MYFIKYIVETFLRFLPFPRKTGLIKIGSPDRNSPVFLTCNFDLTVEMLKRAIRGSDAYLLVANSRGINVWCGAAGGRFTNHDVISVLKTSGIENLIEHRTVILPQLSAVGIQPHIIYQKTGWRAVFGPVYAKDIIKYINAGNKKTEQMRKVRFGFFDRLEVAVLWAFPMSVISAVILAFLWQKMIVPSVSIAWAVSLIVFLSFPLYSKYINPKRERKGFLIFDFGKIAVMIIFLCFIITYVSLYTLLIDRFESGLFLSLGAVALIVIFIISIDLAGSTPVYKSGLHKENMLRVVLDKNRCRGTGVCEDVCPRNCFEVDRKNHITKMPRIDLCEQCGACIVQCPSDALRFKTLDGKIISPETIREFKLNLIGKRMVNTK